MFTCELPAAARLTGIGMVMICWPFSDWGNDKAVGVGWKLNIERLASWRVVGAYTIPWGVWYITTPGVIAAEFCEPTINHQIVSYSWFYRYRKHLLMKLHQIIREWLKWLLKSSNFTLRCVKLIACVSITPTSENKTCEYWGIYLFERSVGLQCWHWSRWSCYQNLTPRSPLTVGRGSHH